MRYLLVVLLFMVLPISAQKRQQDEAQIKEIYHEALANGMGYSWLNHLSNQIGSRLSGSRQAEQAVQYTKSILDSMGLDKVWLQPVKVPKWVRGIPEFAYIENQSGFTNNVPICALGGSVATPMGGIKAKVVEVRGIEELSKLGTEKIKGKIVFFNKPMDPTFIDTFQAYMESADQRYSGAAEAGKYGAVGVIVRSLNLRLDDFPHAGAMSYGDLPMEKRVPAAAISTNGAELLSATLKLNPDIKFFFRQNCKTLPDVDSYNVIGEIRGSTHPDEILVVGAHLDSWDLGDGSHDDGAGCVQSIEVLRLFQKTGYRPKRTIRVVLYMNEENGLRGGTTYAAEAVRKKEDHIFALESDSGGFTPRGFSFDCGRADFERVLDWKKLFEPYMVHLFVQGGGGADIGPLKNDKIVLAGLKPDPQRYFDHHHSANDIFEHINKRELELGAATMASLVYLFDKYGTASSDK